METSSFRSVLGGPIAKLAVLHQICDTRLSQTVDSSHRTEEVRSLIPESLEGVDFDIIGYHRFCY